MPVHKRITGDRRQAVTATLVRNGSAVDLTGLTVQFAMFDSAGTVKVNYASATVDSASAGQVSYDFTAADVDTAGTYDAYFVVVESSLTEHFPNNEGEFQVVIEDP